MWGQAVPYKVPTNVDNALQIVQDIIKQNPPGVLQKTLVSMVYGDMNCTHGKGVTRKLRKMVQSMGLNHFAALPAF